MRPRFRLSTCSWRNRCVWNDCGRWGGGQELSCGEGVASLGVVVTEHILIENESQIQAINLQLEEKVSGGVTGQIVGGGGKNCLIGKW